MAMRYTHLFFDLDNTLWDFNSNSYDALYVTMDKMGLLPIIGDYDRFFKIYHDVNERLWADYREGTLSKSILRVQRFEESLERNGTPIKGIGEELNDKYLGEMPLKTKLVNGALKVLDYLNSRYEMAIITNGFREVQYDKMEQSRLAPYFKKVFVSEEVGAQKPKKEIFEHAVKSMNARKRSTLMIGDSWEADIVGAMNFGIDQVYYNPKIEDKQWTGRFFSAKSQNLDDILATPPIFSEHSSPKNSKNSHSTIIISDLHQLIDLL